MARENNPNQQAIDWLQQQDSHDEISLLELLRVIPYQWKAFLTIIIVSLLAAVFYINILPETYESSSSILMEREDTFSDTAQDRRRESDLLTLRIHSIRATLLSSASVKDMLESLEMITADTPEEEVAAKVYGFKNSVMFNFDNVSFVNQRTGRHAEYSLGFTVGYEHRSPEMSYLGAQELTDRLLNYSSGRVTQQAEEETRFLEQNMERAKAELDAAESELTAFKEENSLLLPHMQSVSIRRIENLTRQIETGDGRIASLRDRLEDAEAQLVSLKRDTSIYSTSGERIASPQDQLTILELEYAAARKKYAYNHPDIIRMQEQMSALRDVASRSGAAHTGDLQQELARERSELNILLNRYSDKHPDVRAKRERIEYLESQIASGNIHSEQQVGGSNLAYNNLMSRKRSLQADISYALQGQEQARIDLAQIESRMMDFPAVEQRLRTLEKQRDQADENYLKAQNRLRVTKGTLIKREADLSERFVLLEPAHLPAKPSKPNKKILYLAASVLSVLIAYAFVFIRHLVRDTILSSRDVEAVTKLPVFLIPEFK